MVIFHCYVSSPEGNITYNSWTLWGLSSASRRQASQGQGLCDLRLHSGCRRLGATTWNSAIFSQVGDQQISKIHILMYLFTIFCDQQISKMHQNTSKYSKPWNQYTVMWHSSMQHTANARCLMSIAWSTGETVDVKGRKVPVLSWSDVIEMGGSLAWRGYDDSGTQNAIGSMVLLYMVLHGSHQYTPFMLAYIPAPWILWECYSSSFFIIDDRLLPFHASFIIVFIIFKFKK